MFAAVLLVFWGAATTMAQTVPVTVEVEGSDVPDPGDPGIAPPSDTPSPAPPVGEEPPPAAADPPDDPLARTGASVLRTVRDAAALIAAGLLLLMATREPRRNR